MHRLNKWLLLTVLGRENSDCRSKDYIPHGSERLGFTGFSCVLRRLSSGGYLSPQPVWRKVFPLWNEFKAQRELGAWLTIKLGKTRLKWQLACGEEPSLLSRSEIRPLTGTAVDKTEQNLVSTAFILQRINSNNSGRTRRNNRRCNRNSSKQLTYIWFFYNHWRQKNTIEI